VIGVWGANCYAPGGPALFETYECNLFLPLDPSNLVRAWDASKEAGMSLWVGNEPLDTPRDLELARRVVERRALIRGTDDHRELQVDLTLMMAGFDFETAWAERRTFLADNVPIPVARLPHLVQSKEAAGPD